MQVSHELPLNLLNKSYLWNDYDYCLPHLIDKHTAYKEYFIRARRHGRFIICDNGLFEGVTHTEKDLIEKINLIKPDIFIVPDEWNDTALTHRNAKYWMNVIKEQLPKETELMVVMQGHTLGDFMNLYNQCIALGYTHFAFNHSSIYYQHDGYHLNPLVNQMMNRIYIISRLYKEKIIKDSHYVHLLGASLPQEFLYYNDPKYAFIKSVDTSNPVIVGALGQFYKEYGLLTKPKNKIEEFMEREFSKKEIEVIQSNINKFKSFIK
jgi:hypothetical protein